MEKSTKVDTNLLEHPGEGFAGFAKYTDFKHKAEVYYLSRKMHNFEFESVKKANLFGLPTLFF